MSYSLFLEQLLNGAQLGVMLFLISAGLTLVFGIMNFINLAHGSLYMIGAFVAASVIRWSGSFALAVVVTVPATALIGAAIELTILRRFYQRNHLDQVLVTFGIILVIDELARIIWGPLPLRVPLPTYLVGTIEVLPDVQYPIIRLAIIGTGLLVAILLYFLVVHTRLGIWVRAGASDRAMAGALGVNVQQLFSFVFAIGAGLAALAGIMAAPILAVQVGMGEPILILALVVIVIGGIGSIRGAFVAALLIGIVDTFGRVLLPSALGSMVIFMLMALVLAWFPRGLFPSHA